MSGDATLSAAELQVRSGLLQQLRAESAKKAQVTRRRNAALRAAAEAAARGQEPAPPPASPPPPPKAQRAARRRPRRSYSREAPSSRLPKLPPPKVAPVPLSSSPVLRKQRQTVQFVELLMAQAEKQGYPACVPTLDRIERLLGLTP